MRNFLVLLLTVVCLSCGYGSKNTTPQMTGTTPTITDLVPDNKNAGSGNFILTVNGGSFASNAKVNWNGIAQSTSMMAGNQLTVNVPASMVATPGMVSITVTNPGTAGGIYGGGTAPATSAAKTFTIN
ncbi:MAG TPA: hypothetical protein VGF06_04520 [Terriglobales bacterium]